MDGYAICSACARHVKNSERACPFCGAAVAARPSVPAAPTRRMGRARWLAGASSAMAVIGCNSGATTSGPGADAALTDVGMSSEAESLEGASASEASSPLPEAALETGTDAVADASSPTDGPVDGAQPSAACGAAHGQGTFKCADTGYVVDGQDDAGNYVVTQADASLYCDRSTQYCFAQDMARSCEPLAKVVCDVACDSGLLRCACPPYPYSGGWPFNGSCSDDDAGGVVVGAPCYGAPPARLERIFAAASDAA